MVKVKTKKIKEIIEKEKEQKNEQEGDVDEINLGVPVFYKGLTYQGTYKRGQIDDEVFDVLKNFSGDNWKQNGNVVVVKKDTTNPCGR